MKTYNIHNIDEWELISFDIDIPMKRSIRKLKMGNPIEIVSSNNGFKPECVYKNNNNGEKIVYVFHECTPNLINKYAVYKLK